MARAYGTARDLLDDIVALAELYFDRREVAQDSQTARALANTDSALVSLGELVEARIAATGDRDVLPLEVLAERFGLTPTERRCLWLLVAIEVSAKLRALAAKGATLALLDELVYADRTVRDRFATELGVRGSLWSCCLVEWVDDAVEQGRLHRKLRVVERVVDLALGNRELAADVAAFASLERAPPPGADLLVDERLHTSLVGAMKESFRSIVVVSGPHGSGRRSLVLSAAHAIASPVLLVRCGDLAVRDGFGASLGALQREAVLFGAVILLLDVDQLSEERSKHLGRYLATYPGKLVATSCARGVGSVFESHGVVAIELAIPQERVRAELWLRELGPGSGELAASAAARYSVTGGVIIRAARMVREQTRVQERIATLADVQAGIRGTLDDKLGTLGTLVQWSQSWEDLVLPDDSRDDLFEMIARVRFRRTVLDDWGFARKVAKGLGMPVLFSGPPGTGKTMAAGLVASELGLDLYQIDLSRMVSKYVGETEKQLARLFDAAESGHAILLFDEADSLFAKRTDVKSANDRYANLEVNYLLQRMEAFSGITILTTNLDASIDEAFRRRLAFRIVFPLPDARERARLWRRVLPDNAWLAGDIDYAELGNRFEMSGGYIRNAALRAAYLAASESSAIAMSHLFGAAMLEYAAMGKVMATSTLGTLGRR